MASTTIEPGMKVAVRRGIQDHVGVVVRLEGDDVIVCLTQADRLEELELRVKRNEVTPLDGWV